MDIPRPIQPPCAFARFTAPEKRALLLALFVATVVKIVLAVISDGSGDLNLFFKFARQIHNEGLFPLYVSQPMFNHTPLASGFISLLVFLSAGKYIIFAALLRITCAMADIGLFLAVLRAASLQTNRIPLWALLLFTLSPVTLLISGYHGNIDPIMTLFLFLAALACMEDRVVLSAVFFGIACNVKIVPILFAPVFFFFWLHRGRGFRFAGIAGGIMLAGLGLPLLHCPSAYLHKVFGYGSYWGVWGFPYLLRQAGIPSAQYIGFLHLSPFQAHVATLLKGLMAASILLLGWRRRGVKKEVFGSTLAICWCLFFVFAPGMGVQYLVWLAPFLLLYSVRSYAWITLLSTAVLLAYYQFFFRSTPKFPWFEIASGGVDSVAWGSCNLLLWIAFGATLFTHGLASWRMDDNTPLPTSREPGQK